jgi:predicted site-specific integrase-resolvase
MKKQATAAQIPVMSVYAASQKLGVRVQSIYRWLEDGTLQRYTAVEGGTVLVISESVETLMEKRAQEQARKAAAAELAEARAAEHAAELERVTGGQPA